MNRFSSAFTLIELLVVVAVIAILAAIAVPNFLEAQTRAKVSRVKADMRTIATALESYRVDGNNYPPDMQYGTFPFVERLARLTTPISYITSVPRDPFVDEGSILELTATGLQNAYAQLATPNQFIYPLTYDYAYRIQPGGIPESIGAWRNITRYPGNVLWAMRSAGPDRWPAYLATDMPGYDPTNGTVSRGNIYWTGPGVGEDAPLI